MQIIEISKETKQILNSLKPDYLQYSQMKKNEREFLTENILRTKPKKVLELGVSAGGSSIIILNAIKDIENSHLYSIDYVKRWSENKKMKVGFIVDEYKELQNKWTLKTGGLVSDFIEEIGNDIDFCFIDTAHMCPGEILDFILIFPFLKKNCTILFHDINLQIYHKKSISNNMLISALSGDKLIEENYHKKIINVGGVILDDNQKEKIWDIFNLLNQNWQYIPKDSDIASIKNIITKYYPKYYSEIFNTILDKQKEIRSKLTKEDIDNINKFWKYQLGYKLTTGKLKQYFKNKMRELSYWR